MIYLGDCVDVMKRLEPNSVHCCITSPPYWGLRNYGVPGQFGLEETPKEFVANLVKAFREVSRLLRPDGTLWLNLGDCYFGSTGTGGRPGDLQYNQKGSRTVKSRPKVPTGQKRKNLVGIPWQTAFALQDDGWNLKEDIIWQKPYCMPESVKDRPPKKHEHVFLFSKSHEYYYDQEAAKVPGPQPGQWQNIGTVWTIAPQHLRGGVHIAMMPEKLVEPCIKLGCPVGGVVLDPFAGAGTVGVVAKKLGRKFIGIELNPEYVEEAEMRINNARPRSGV